jgi:hypothetical protein
MLEKVFDKLEFGGESPLTIRAWCSTFRYCPVPLGIDTAKQLNKLEFDEGGNVYDETEGSYL